MSRFDGGWIKLHRKICDSWMGKDSVTLSLFITLLSWATYKKTRVLIKGKITELPNGSVLTSCKQLAEQLNCDRKTIQRRLNLLESDNTIVQQVSNKGRVITICNWEKYQHEDSDDVQQVAYKVPPTSPSKSHPSPIQVPPTSPLSEEGNKVKKVKNVKKVRNSIPTENGGVSDQKKISKRKGGSKKPEPQESDFDLAKDWLNFSHNEMPWQKSWTQEKFAKAIVEVRCKTDLSPTGARKLFEYIKSDEFWRRNAVSPIGLLKKNGNDMRKVDTILVRMRSKVDRMGEAIQRHINEPVSEDIVNNPFLNLGG